MNVSLYQAAAAMNAHARWQDMIAQNLASASVPGYRKHDISFQAVQAGTIPGSTPNPVYVPAGMDSINFSQGALRPTNGPTDFALQGPGFFEVQLPNGSHAFTRDGEFQFDAQGQLVTKQGYLVISAAGPLQMDHNNASPMSVSATGEVSQAGVAKGRLRMVEFNDPSKLTAIGEGLFLADQPGALAADSTSTQVRQGYLEVANTTPTGEMANLITSLRMFESNQKVMQVQDDRLGRVISELGAAT